MTTPAPSPADRSELAAMSDELLGVSRRAVAAGAYETAYHALAAAVHAASDAGDEGRLGELRLETRRQQAAVNDHAPDHRLSSGSGTKRGHPGWLEALAVVIDAAAARLRGTTAVARAAAVRGRQ